jgi:hypothetical protein
VAPGNFMKEWFDYAKEQHKQLVADPLSLTEELDIGAIHRTAFCAASVEWLCDRYSVPSPSWMHDLLRIVYLAYSTNTSTALSISAVSSDMVSG